MTGSQLNRRLVVNIDYLILPIALMTGLSTAGLCFSVLYNPAKNVTKKAVRNMTAEHDRDTFFANLLQNNKKEKASRTPSVKVSKKFEQEYETAGLNIPAGQFVFLWMMATILPMLIVLLATGKTIAMAGAAAGGFLCPIILFEKKRSDRAKAFNAQFADALLTICNGLQSGFSFQQAMTAITRDMEPPISSEFETCLEEIDYGVSQHEALYHMYGRTKCEDIKMLISALDITQKTGGSLADVLQTISETVRTRIKIRQEVNTLSAQGKMSSIIVGGLPVFIMIALSVLNPDYVGQLTGTHDGQILLAVAAVMESVGFIVMQKVTDVKL